VVYLRKVELNVGDVALKFEFQSRHFIYRRYLEEMCLKLAKIQRLYTYCSNDKASLPCGELLTSVKYFLVALPYSQTTFVTVLMVYQSKYKAAFQKESSATSKHLV